MSDFASSYLGRLRAVVGSRLLLMPSTHVVLEDDRGRILLELRSDFGAWGLPGGVPDEREDIITCAERETFEETGLQIRNLKPFGFASRPDVGVFVYPNGHACHYFALLLTSREFSGDLASDAARTPGSNGSSLKRSRRSSPQACLSSRPSLPGRRRARFS